jgi:hypothetical protein
VSDHDILEIARKLRMDLTNMQAKLSELMRLAALLEAPAEDARACPECGLHARALPQGATLADHRWTTHGVEAIDGRAA